MCCTVQCVLGTLCNVHPGYTSIPIIHCIRRMRNFEEQLHKISNFNTEKNRTREGKGRLFLNKGNEWSICSELPLHLLSGEHYNTVNLQSAYLLKLRAHICKHFKGLRNRFPAWRTGTTTLFFVPAARLHSLAESIIWLHKRLQIRSLVKALCQSIWMNGVQMDGNTFRSYFRRLCWTLMC
jgi:hypothetical protein